MTQEPTARGAGTDALKDSDFSLPPLAAFAGEVKTARALINAGAVKPRKSWLSRLVGR